MIRFTFCNSVMLLAISAATTAPVFAQQHLPAKVHTSVVLADDPVDPNPVPPPDPGTPPEASIFALHS